MTLIPARVRARVSPASPLDSPSHIFAVGQLVRQKHPFPGLLQQVDIFRITRLLPPLGDAPQYRIRSAAERYERVSAQDELQPLSPAEADAAAMEGNI